MHFTIDQLENDFNLKSIDKKTKILELKNIQLNFDWEIIIKDKINFTHLKLNNCLINIYNFFTVLKKINELKTLEIDHYCYFFEAEKNKLPLIEITNIKKYIYNFPAEEDLKIDLELIFADRGKKSFLTNYPNFQKLFKSLEEIEFNNFECFLKYRQYYASNDDIFPGSKFYQLERIKSLRNINIINESKKIENSDLCLVKILQLPSSKNIKINNSLIENYKKKYLNEKVLYLDFDINNIDDETISLGTDPKKKLKYKKINWFAKVRTANYGSELMRSIIPEDIEHLIIGSTYEFIRPNDYEASWRIKENIENCKKLKSVTFEISNKIINFNKDDEYHRHHFNGQLDEDNVGELFGWIRELLDKYKNCEVIIKNLSEEDTWDSSKFLFYWVIYSKSFNKNIIFEDFKPYDQIKSYCEDFLRNNVEVLHVIDEKDAEIDEIKNLNNIEVAIDHWEYGLNTSCGLKRVEWSEHTEAYHSFFNDIFYYKKNSNSQKTYFIAKKEFLDNAKKNIFDNVKEVYFYKIAKQDIYNNYSETIKHPNSINYKNCKILHISYGDKVDFKNVEKNFPNLESICIKSGVITTKDGRDLPRLTNLKNFEVINSYEIDGGDKNGEYKNFTANQNLESIEISGLYSFNDDETRWQTTDVKCKEFKNLPKLKSLKLFGLEKQHLKNLNGLKNLEILQLNISLITKSAGSDSGEFDKPYENEDFNFFSDLICIKELNIYFGNSHIRENYINIDFDKLLKSIPKTIERLKLAIGFFDKISEKTDELINAISKYLKNLKELDISIHCSKEIIEKKSTFEVKNTDIQWKKGDPSPFNHTLDCIFLKDFKFLEKFGFSFEDTHYYKKNDNSETTFLIKNASVLLNLPNIKKIEINEQKFEDKDLNKIFSEKGNKTDQFLLQFNENSSQKEIIKYRGRLPKDVLAEYDKIEDENEYSLSFNSDDIYEILLKRLAKRLNKKL